MRQRIDKLVHWMKQQHVDAVWITSTENVYYLTGCYVEPHERTFGLFLFAKGDAVLVFPKLEAEAVYAAGWNDAVIAYDDSQEPWQLFQERFQQDLAALNVIALEQEATTYAQFLQFKAVFPQHIEWVGVDQALQQIRMIKDQHEIKQIEQAAQLADEAMELAVASMREGCSELEMVAEIEFALKKRGIHKMAFDTLVLFGEKTALPHGMPDQTMLKSGDMILIDLGVRVNGYCSDITRTFVYKSIQKKQKEIGEIVLHAQQTAIQACKPQTPIYQIDEVARAIITDAGYGEYFIHRTGHGLGLGIHEYPSVSATNHALLQPGMVVTIEPGIYIPKVGGVRIEDDIAITEEGYRVLTQFPRDLQVLK